MLAVCWSGLDSVEQLEGAHQSTQVVDDYSYLCCLDGFARLLETPATLLVKPVDGTQKMNTRAGTAKACRRSHLSFDHGGQLSELLNQGRPREGGH